MEFKSQVCTTREQSERLLALGLKKETADMMYITSVVDGLGKWLPEEYRYYSLEIGKYHKPIGKGMLHIPAWSLHRLIEMIPLDIWHTEYENGPRLKHTFWFCKHAPSYNSVENIDFRAHPNLYDNIIDCIEWLINEGYFNKDYLEEKKWQKTKSQAKNCKTF